MSSIFEKYVGKGKEVLLGEDMFTILPLTIKEMPLLMRVSKKFNGLNEDSTQEEFVDRLDEQALKDIAELIDITLKKSYPDEDSETLERFGMKFMMTLLGAIIEINTDPTAINNLEKTDKINKLKERIRNDKPHS